MIEREAIRYINAYVAVNKELDRKEKEAFQMAISALKKQEWIPCSKMLPTKSGLYRVTARELGTDVVFDLYYSEKHGWDGWWNGKVLAWKPIEEPYKAEEEYDDND